MTRTVGAVAAAVLIGAAVSMVVAWRPWESGSAHAAPAIDLDPDQKPGDKFAEDRGPAGVKAVPFDADRAVKYLRQLCDLGPRVSGSEGMAKQQELVTKHFETHGAKVTRQEFDATQNSRRDKVKMVNLVAAWHPDRPRRVILCSHYDTRPLAHEEPNRANWNKTFLSANDGTSGVAMFMELAHHMSDLPTTFGVDFVLFDGEEYVFELAGPGGFGGDRYFLGSEHFAAEYAKAKGTRKHTYEAAVLFDLFAHAGAVLPVEGNSFELAPALTEQVWKVAAAVGAKSFVWQAGATVRDDHLALNEAGIPAVDVIDFVNYKAHWHRLTDTPDKVSGAQMAEVAKVAAAWLQLIR